MRSSHLLMSVSGITDIGKWTVGRLRPHFIDGCKPDIDLSKCVVGQYIYNFTCQQTDMEIYNDLRLSFPSGHASQSAYTMIFLAVSQQHLASQPHVPRVFYVPKLQRF